MSGENHDLWVFGYGSLIFKADFPFIEKRPAYIKGFQRRFWQGSHDHRGTPNAPGRVVTLINSPDTLCMGMAYKLNSEVLLHLDYREKNGYVRFNTDLYFTTPDNKEKTRAANEQALLYVATETNPAFLGKATEQAIAQHIFESRGPSGENSEYLLLLAESLRELNANDDHVFAIEHHLRELQERELL